MEETLLYSTCLASSTLSIDGQTVMGTEAWVAAVALTSAGVFAGTLFSFSRLGLKIQSGYTWALSHAGMPAVFLAPEALQAGQWRLQYLMGFYVCGQTETVEVELT